MSMTGKNRGHFWIIARGLLSGYYSTRTSIVKKNVGKKHLTRQGDRPVRLHRDPTMGGLGIIGHIRPYPYILRVHMMMVIGNKMKCDRRAE